jgi:hypothetical protein
VERAIVSLEDRGRRIGEELAELDSRRERVLMA